MCKFVFALYFLTFIYHTQRKVDAAPYDDEAIIVIPFKASDERFTKIKSFKIDGQAAVKQLTSRVSAEKILRTLSNVPEFDILVEGLDAITFGDAYKAAFPSGILQYISEHYSRSASLKSNEVAIVKPEIVESIKTTKIEDIEIGDEKSDDDIADQTEIPYDEVHEDDIQDKNEELKEQPITDDYVYDQPDEDRFTGEREYVTRKIGEIDKKIENEGIQDSKKFSLEKNPNEVVSNEKLTDKNISIYGATFRNWMTKFLTG